MPSIYLAEPAGQLVTIGYDGKPYTDAAAKASADERNARAIELGIKARYVVGPDWAKPAGKF